MGRLSVSIPRVYLDTTVFIGMLEATDSRSDRFARLVLEGPDRDPENFVTSQLTLAELLVKPLKENDRRRIDTYESWLRAGGSVLSGRVELHRIDPSVLLGAATLRARHRGLKLPDAIHLATALAADCAVMLTADQRLQGIYGTEPGAVRYGVPPGRTVSILHSDDSTLDRLSSGQAP